MAAGIACACLLGLLWLWRRPPPAPPAPSAQTHAYGGRAEEEPVDGRVDDPKQSRLPSADDALLERDEQAIDGLIDLLADKSELLDAKPLRERFMREFYDEPRLAAALDARGQQPKASRKPLRVFLRGLADLPEFRRLAARFARAAGTSARLPVAAPLSPGSRTGPGGPRADGGALAAATAVAPPGQPEGTRFVGAKVQTLVRDFLRGAARFRSRGSPAGQGHSGGAGGAPGAQAGSGTHNVAPKLEAIDAAGPDTWQSPTKYLKELLLRMPKDDRLVIEEKLGEEDLWGACFITGRYPLCGQKCGEMRETPCTDLPDSFSACWRDGLRTKIDCVRLCTDRPDLSCTVPSAERSAVCAPGASAIACGYCSSAAPWGPPICSGDPVVCVQPTGCGAFDGGAPAAMAPAEPPPAAGPAPAADTSGGCTAGWSTCQWVMASNGQKCAPICTRYCSTPDMAQSCGTCPPPQPAQQPLCRCNAVPCGPGEGGAPPPGGCRVIGSAHCFYGPDGGLTTCAAGGQCP